MAGPTQAPTNSVNPQLDIGTPSLDQSAGSGALNDIRSQALDATRNQAPTQNTDANNTLTNNEGMLVAQLSLPNIDLGAAVDNARQSLQDTIRAARDTVKSWGPGLIVNLSGTQINMLGNGQIGPLPSGQQSGDGFDADAIRLTSNLGPYVRVNGATVPTNPDYCIKIPNFSGAVLTRAADGVVDISFEQSPASGEWSIKTVSSIVGGNPSWNPQMPTETVDQINRDIFQMIYNEQQVTVPRQPYIPSGSDMSIFEDSTTQALRQAPPITSAATTAAQYAAPSYGQLPGLAEGYVQLQNLRDGRNNQGSFNQGHAGYGVIAIKAELYEWAARTGNPYRNEYNPASNVFSDAERRAIESFQRNIGIPVDGTVGPRTAEALLWMRQQRELGRI